ncbi:hypothetical protein HMPREF9554_01563 [Treponema phagedenis F0421]|nr:hypothetical protein HMPREF9554_01563 [Treponema phagedenis F0421]
MLSPYSGNLFNYPTSYHNYKQVSYNVKSFFTFLLLFFTECCIIKLKFEEKE